MKRSFLPAYGIVLALSIASAQPTFAQHLPRRTATLTSPINGRNTMQLEITSTAAVQNTRSLIQKEGFQVAEPASSPARRRALSFIEANAQAFGLASAGNVTLKSESPADEVGMEHVKFQQLHKGVPVTGGEMIVHLKGDRVLSASSEFVIDADLEVNPTLSAAQALERARIRMSTATNRLQWSEPRLQVFNKGVLTDTAAPTRLAYFIEATGDAVRQFIWVDAATGDILLDFNQAATALHREIYTADSTSTLPGRSLREEGARATGNADADLAYQYLGDTYQYFLVNHGRDSFDNEGGTIKATVQYCDPSQTCPTRNAAWTQGQMVYGAGFSQAADITAHELTHGITERTANLFYYMQSGALNESYSDIFGETVDITRSVTTGCRGVRWQIGECLDTRLVYPQSLPLRDMMHPHDGGQPETVSDANWHTEQTVDNGGVHINSGVPNYAYALMVDGGFFGGKTITPIGLDSAAKIQYRALTVYLTSGANFIDNYNALQYACEDLVGTNRITTDTCLQVQAATDAVKMNGIIPNNPTPPQFCPAGDFTALFEDGFEQAGTGRWITTTLSGRGSWTLPSSTWVKTGTGSARGGVPSEQPPSGLSSTYEPSDMTLEMSSDVALPKLARLQFNHAYELLYDEKPNREKEYDMGVVEYSVDGGANWMDARGLFAGGDHYDAKALLSDDSTNPLHRQYSQGFAGSSFGYTATQLNLGSLAGQNFRLRFRLGTAKRDAVSQGWAIDDFRVYSCNCTYTVTASETHILELGGSGSIVIEPNYDECDWEILDAPSWIKFSVTKGSGQQRVNYQVELNPASARSATLRIGNQTIVITQEPSRVCDFKVTTLTSAFPANGGDGELNVTSPNSSCAWTAASIVPWIHVSRNQGTGTAAFSFSVDRNTASTPRTAALAVANQPVVITQEAAACAFSLDHTGGTIPAAGASTSVQVTASGSQCSWHAEGAPSWITISSAPTSGSGNILMTVMPNTTPASRSSSTLTIAGHPFVITQAAAPACTFSLDRTGATIPAAGASTSVQVTASGTQCSWHAEGSPSWITISSASTSGSGNILMTVMPNTTPATRSSSTLTVAGQPFVITQAAAPACTFSLDRTGGTIPPAGGSTSVQVTASGSQCSWHAEGAPSWVTISSAPTSGSGNILMTVMPNTTPATRSSSTLTIAGQPFVITQAAAPVCTFSLDRTGGTIPAAGASTSVQVTASGSQCSWQAAGAPSWITISSTSTSGSGNILMTVMPNTTPATRSSSTLTIAGQPFVITQATAPVCTFSLDRTGGTIPAAGASTSVQVTASGPQCSWQAAGAPSWITISSAPTSGSGNILMTVMPNTTPATRSSSTMTIAGLPFVITQAAAPACTFSFDRTGATIPAAGASTSVQVTASGSQCSWHAEGAPSWITISSASTSGSGNILMTVMPNTTPATRVSSTLTIAGHPFVITQAAAPACTFSLDRTGGTIPPAGGATSVQVTASGSQCSWQAAGAPSWITISGASTSGSGNILMTVMPNTTPTTRYSSTMTIAGQPFIITQAGNTQFSGIVITNDPLDRLEWLSRPSASSNLEFEVCLEPSLTKEKKLVVNGPSGILANLTVNNGNRCASEMIPTSRLSSGMYLDFYKAKTFGIPTLVLHQIFTYFGPLQSGGRLSITWTKD